MSKPVSPREFEIVELIALGLSSRQIADKLGIVTGTVETHIKNMFLKLSVNKRVQLPGILLGPQSAENAVAPVTRVSRTNLPQLTSPIGRDTDIEAIIVDLRDHQLVTLTGAGGVGKTRTAVAIGEAFLDDIKSGVWLVELGRLAQGSSVVAAVAQALSVQELPDAPLLNKLLAFLKPKPLLLILDNCEHVHIKVASLVKVLLRGCPQLRIIATSRERLHIAGEKSRRIPSLRLPPREHLRLSADEASRYSAIQLFVQRAKAAVDGFEITDRNAPTVANICRRLDGIPLAIELAAARAILSVEKLSISLDESFHILSDGDPTIPRQTTMHAAIEWSYNLLKPTEQRLFERLSVFVGGFTLATAVAVCVDDVMSAHNYVLLLSLIEKSLVEVDPFGSEPRFKLLEPFRQYAAAKLADRGEVTLVAHRHAQTYTELAEQLEREHDIRPDSAWFARAELELDNWRAALHLTLTKCDDVLLGQRLAGALDPAWRHFSSAEGRRWLQAAQNLVDAQTPPIVTAQLQYAAARLAYAFGEYETSLSVSRHLITVNGRPDAALGKARAEYLAGRSLVKMRQAVNGKLLLQAALGAARLLENRRLTGLVLDGIAEAAVHIEPPELSEARACLDEALQIYDGIGAERYAAHTMITLAEIEFREGNIERAIDLVSQSLAKLRVIGFTSFVTNALNNLTGYLIARGDRWTSARAYAREALTLAQATQFYSQLVCALQHLVAVAILPSPNEPTPAQFRCAAHLLGYIDRRISVLGTSRTLAEEQERDHVFTALCNAIGANEATRLAANGAGMTEAQAVEAGLRL